jgi:peptide chain release factor 1
MEIKSKIEELRKEYNKLKEEIASPEIIKQPELYKKVASRFKEIDEILSNYDELEKIKQRIEENKKAMAEESDEELISLFEEENEKLTQKAEKATDKLKSLLIPKDENDSKNAIMEIRAGTGGEEAALFASDLFRMYSRFVEKKGGKVNVLSSNPTGMGGLKEIIFEVSGKDAYGTLKYESGVHRVQRVPETESGGRIHTSAASVVVFPEAEDVDVEIDENDIQIDVFRSSGPGGQSVNTTDSAVRVTHLPTGIVVTCQDERSQLQNKIKALKVLRARLLDMEMQKQRESIAKERKLMVGSGDRSAKVRTYNFPQSRVTDHRINYTTHNLEGILGGNLDELIDALHFAAQEEKLALIND